MEYVYDIPSPVGTLTVSSDGEYVSGLWIAGQKYFVETLGTDVRKQHIPVFKAVQKWLDIYFSGDEPDFMPPLMPRGTPFQKTVWDMLCTIAYGHTVSYGELAKQLELNRGRRTSARALGGAVGRNPISILIPCHRVLGKNGDLTGYAGGIDVKQRLLKMEGLEA
jgi:methylated-DNA-[protein]-cysteine S-methyltransferase